MRTQGGRYIYSLCRVHGGESMLERWSSLAQRGTDSVTWPKSMHIIEREVMPVPP